jgi:ketosteroid isomerase-like protein
MTVLLKPPGLWSQPTIWGIVPCKRSCTRSVVAYADARRTFPMKPLSCPVLSMVISVALAIPKTTSAQTTHDRDVHELERLETVWNEAHEHGDVDVLEKLWADDMEVAVPKMPVLTKADALKFARSGRMKFLNYRTSDIRVRVYDNAAVVTGRLQRTRSMNGQEISDDWRFTKTYVREAGQWRVVSFHASEAAQP